MLADIDEGDDDAADVADEDTGDDADEEDAVLELPQADRVIAAAAAAMVLVLVMR